MGYRPGEGLGKKRTGIARAIEVKMRPNQMGLGYAGQEHQLVEKAKEEVRGGDGSGGEGESEGQSEGEHQLVEKAKKEVGVGVGVRVRVAW